MPDVVMFIGLPPWSRGWGDGNYPFVEVRARLKMHDSQPLALVA